MARSLMCKRPLPAQLHLPLGYTCSLSFVTAYTVRERVPDGTNACLALPDRVTPIPANLYKRAHSRCPRKAW